MDGQMKNIEEILMISNESFVKEEKIKLKLQLKNIPFDEKYSRRNVEQLRRI